MRKYILYGILGLGAMSLVSCNDWLSEEGPMTNSPEDYFTGEAAAIQHTLLSCGSTTALIIVNGSSVT